MISDHAEILRCLRNKSVSELTSFDFETPSFLTSMGPSKDGVIISNDFGSDAITASKKRDAAASNYQGRRALF